MKNNSKVLLFLLVLLGLVISCKHSKSQQSGDLEKTWVKLFNGQNLDGWKIKIRGQEFGVNYKNTFRVVDGVMQVNYEEYDSFDDTFGHIYYDKAYSDYKFRMEYRFLGDQVPGGPGWAIKNSGIMIHCQDPETIALHQNFPVSVEVQLLGGLGEGERPTGNVCTPGTHIVMDNDTITRHCINSTSKTYHDDAWIRVELLVRNDSIIKHFINGEEVLRYARPHYGGSIDADTAFWKSKAGNPLRKGYISLQSESHPVEFRNIEIFELN